MWDGLLFYSTCVEVDALLHVTPALTGAAAALLACFDPCCCALFCLDVRVLTHVGVTGLTQEGACPVFSGYHL